MGFYFFTLRNLSENDCILRNLFEKRLYINKNPRMNKDDACTFILIVLAVVIIFLYSPKATTTAPIPLPAYNDRFTVETCYAFTKNFLEMTDVDIMAALCTRLSLIMEADIDGSKYIPIPQGELTRVCNFILTCDPYKMPYSFKPYAYHTLKTICKDYYTFD